MESKSPLATLFILFYFRSTTGKGIALTDRDATYLINYLAFGRFSALIIVLR